MRNNTNNHIWTPLAYSLILGVGLLTGFLLRTEAPLISFGSGSNSGLAGGRVEQLMGYIEARYVDEPDQERLYEAAINAVLEELDPHSSYIPKDEMQALTESMEGNFEGIGIEYLVVDDTITVVSALPDGPSAEAGLLPGDQIIYVEDSLVTEVEERGIDPASLMRGEGGTDVKLRVRRPGQPKLMAFTITRAPIPVYSVDAAYTIDEETAYVKINRFSQNTYAEFMQALEEHLEKPGAKNLIIDLRGNPGGYLQEATKLLSELFVQRGVLLVYTEGRNSSRQPYKSSGRARYNIQKVAILVDGGSASASEIVAGAVQDHDRGIIVGRRTFGKGLVQEQYPLADSSALRLTVARYYTPSDRSIQRKYDGEEDYRGDLSRRFESGELTGRTDVQVDSSLVYYTDNGYPVYGGGGITPDYYVPLDSSLNNENFLRLRQQIAPYVFGYLRTHPEVKEFKDLAAFRRGFRPDMAAVTAELATLARRDYEDVTTDLPPRLRDELELQFTARLARHLFGAGSYYQIYNQRDETVQEALRLLRNADPLAAARGNK
ncbi:carboxyl-terminal processing protease [Lewinella marina]|uniref:Carboxyl-terminal protease n=1 Tax=Neolewinella marina TaxID=438751 RepID=A0A2G0CFV2_9BACT|nr:S41 family peptidase [Neolewinella marina]NJB85443.1 carboxyl-terminal processing protease [Neolewinella marina]PHK98865.1 carboxyl-terminal protease [Neolewinella marina]